MIKAPVARFRRKSFGHVVYEREESVLTEFLRQLTAFNYAVATALIPVMLMMYIRRR